MNIGFACSFFIISVVCGTPAPLTRLKQISERFLEKKIQIYDDEGVVQYFLQHKMLTGAVLNLVLGNGKCGEQKNKDKIVLDIIANSGLYTIVSAMYGCRCISFEPQPRCTEYINMAVKANNVADKVLIVPHSVARNEVITPVSAETNCMGRFPVHYIERNISRDKWKKDASVNVATLFPFQKILLAKINTGGGEFVALESLMNHLSSGLVDELIVELSPVLWPRLSISPRTAQLWYHSIHNYGYNMIVLFPTPIHINPNTSTINAFFKTSFDQVDMWITRRNAAQAITLLRMVVDKTQ
jgi:hypothetical protein